MQPFDTATLEEEAEFEDCADEVWNYCKYYKFLSQAFMKVDEQSELPDSDSFDVPSSQTLPSTSQSSYVPSSGSSKGQDSEMLDDSFIDGKKYFG